MFETDWGRRRWAMYWSDPVACSWGREDGPGVAFWVISMVKIESLKCICLKKHREDSSYEESVRTGPITYRRYSI